MTDRDQYWYKRANIYAYFVYCMFVDGPRDPEDLFKMMVKDGFVDIDQEWIDE